MQGISERISYLSGLCEGLNITEDAASQGKVLLAIIDVLKLLNDEANRMDFDLLECQDHLEEMDEQLCYVEKFITGQEINEEIVELECAQCGEELFFNAEILDDEDTIEIICPTCQEVVYIHEGAFDYDPSYIESDIESDFEGDIVDQLVWF